MKVVSDCKYIPSSRLGLVEQALLSLQSRVLASGAYASSSGGRADDRGAERDRGGGDRVRDGGRDGSGRSGKERSGADRGGGGGGGGGPRGEADDAGMNPLLPASLGSVDEYLELMYEDGEGKVRGTAQVLQLCTQVGNLEALIQNQSLMALISRLLESEYKVAPPTAGS